MTFDEQRKAWSSVPLDDIGYFDTDYLLGLSDAAFKRLIKRAVRNRYYNGGWRNHWDLWRFRLKLDTTTGKSVLDYGCGAGIEALQYAQTDNSVFLADINRGNLDVAERTLNLHGFEPREKLLIQEEAPFIELSEGIDVVHCSGVLHHIPDPSLLVQWMWEWLILSRGELRLLLYSDRAWEIATGTKPPDDVTRDPNFEEYVRFMDDVGDYADWYSCSKLRRRFSSWFEVKECEYITPDSRYLVAILVPK